MIENEKNRSNEFISFLNDTNKQKYIFNDRVKLCVDIGHLIFEIKIMLHFFTVPAKGRIAE